MQYVCVLISKPGDAAVDDWVVACARGAAASDAPPNWLNRREACDFEIHNLTRPAADIIAETRDAIGDRPLDIAIVPMANRRKRLLVADMDSTMIEQECIDELADAIGIKERVAAITEQAMRGEIGFEGALKARVALLKGLTRETLDRVARERITLTPGGRTLVRTMRLQGAYTALVSGGFTLFTDRVAKALGFNSNQGNTLIFDNDALAGTVADPVLGQDAKRSALRRHMRAQDLTRTQTMAVGDGANDLAMMQEAGLGVAFHAKPVVAEAADAAITHGDLTALLYLQGFLKSEFAE